MPKSKLPFRTVVTPSQVLRLFMSGRDTADIASGLGIREHEAYRLLRISREARRLFNDLDRDTIPAIHEPALENH